MKEVVLVFDGKDLAALGEVRCYPGLQLAADGNLLWLRGIPVSGQGTAEIKRLPAKITYLLDEQDRLFLAGASTPVAQLQKLNWLPATQFIPVTLPLSPLPGKTQETYPVRLRKSEHAVESAALLTTLAEWKIFAETAPATRLDRLQFAVSERNEVLIMGQPLPALRGKEYWITDRLLLPAGFEFDPPALLPLVSEKLKPGSQAYLLFTPDGRWQYISVHAFVAAKRSSIRLTEPAAENG